MQEIDDPLKARTTPIGQYQRCTRIAEHLFQSLDHAIKIRLLGIHTRDDKHAWHALLTRQLPRFTRANLNSRSGIHRDQS